ncbi:MAG: CotH kinase family protein, partial [Balneolia bacterium]|nr:CotH kinase family protein [Balneolia bacterium]
MNTLFCPQRLLMAVAVFLALSLPARAQQGVPADTITTQQQDAGTAAEPESLFAPVFSVAPGFYSEAVELTIESVHSGLTIRYTTDGSEPTSDSPLYEGPIVLDSRAGVPNNISMIPTNDFGSGHLYNEHWQPPLGEVFKIHTIRARVFPDEGEPGEIITGSFLIDESGSERFSLPVISITTHQDSLFSDSRGIYVHGDNTNYNQRGREWERAAWIEFFEPDGTEGFSQQVGLRIHGGTSRSRPRKSLRIYARNDYDAPWINYQIFPDKPIGQFKRLILRNSGNDWDGAVFRDAFMQSLVRGLDIDMQHSRPAIVFINGEYWGIHNIRDRLDDRYLETHYGISDEEDFTIMENNSVFGDGNPDGVNEYNQMRSFLNNPGVSQQSNYEQVRTLMDVENFADYNIAQIYFRNTDWPGNNKQYWKTSNSYDPDAPFGLDGRWRWMLFDTDFGFGLDFDYVQGNQEGPAHNTLAFALQSGGGSWPNPDWSTFILRRLMQNDSFRNDFINRFADLLNTVFEEDYVIAELDSMRAMYEPEMQEHIDRWRRPVTVSSWQNEIDVMADFAAERPGFVRNHIINQFNLSGGTSTVVLDVNDPEKGFVRINRTDLRPETPGVPAETYPWSGTYFSSVSVDLEAIPRTGYQFAGWQGSVVSEDVQITVQPGSGVNLTAVFEAAEDDVTDPVIEPWVMSNGDFEFSEWSASSEPGTWPDHMMFFQTDEADPDLETPREDPWMLAYNLSSRSRINGLGENGISFINTANAQDDGGGFLGSAVLALNTIGMDELYVGWRGGTLLPNSRVYNLRLQYRVGNTGEFEDVTDAAGNPVEYVRNEQENHSVYIGPVQLPSAMLDRSYAELRWNYYYTGIRLDNDSGQRSMLRLDDIIVSTEFSGETSMLGFADLAATAQVDYVMRPFEILAFNENQQVDPGFNQTITLTVEQGPGVLLGTTESTASGGRALFDNITFSEPGTYVLRATAQGGDGFTSTSPQIQVADILEVVMPRLIQGAQPDNNDRIPLAYRLRIEGLSADATYRFANRVIDETDGFDQDGAGNMIFVKTDGSDFVRTTSSPDFSEQAFETGHYEFTTNSEGIFEGWFVTEPSGNRRFEPGNLVRVRMLLNDGNGGEQIQHAIDTFSEIRVAEFGNDQGEATGLAVVSEAIARNFILLFDDASG